MLLVPQRSRLLSVALVCKAWQSAATACTQITVAVSADMERLTALQRMVMKRGSMLETVQLRPSSSELPAQETQQQGLAAPLVSLLSCSMLKELVVSPGCCKLQSPMLPASAAESLTKLEVGLAHISSSVPGTLPHALRSFTKLRHLSFSAAAPAGAQPSSAGKIQVWDWLQHLQQLTCLKLEQATISFQAGGNSSSSSSISDSCSSSGLPLTALRSLDLLDCSCDLACLSNTTSLNSVTVKSTNWMSLTVVDVVCSSLCMASEAAAANQPQPRRPCTCSHGWCHTLLRLDSQLLPAAAGPQRSAASQGCMAANVQPPDGKSPAAAAHPPAAYA